ncbi:hypothetical protein HK097_004642 [Rhizophlyctis rosea]|uniref:L-lactate permease n=1 Tax=Rhizophlyctis rosea TaxID=64517 RepID=A0AAD5X6E4_9FUNG|nr:hypothetical protein HK097_004642 [Rhizophlyctis rosea]
MSAPTQSTIGGPWGPVGDVVISIFPIAFLILVTLLPNGLKSHISLPVSALFLYILRLAYFAATPSIVHAALIQGILNSATPITIVAAAIFLFAALERTKCMDWILRALRDLSGGNLVAMVMLVGWSFTYVVEGASGFGTPAALAAPILAQAGVDPMSAVIMTLMFNPLQTAFGAVGTPIWFGLGTVFTENEDRLDLAFKVQAITCVCSLVIPLFGIRMAVPSWRTIWRNKLFVGISLLSASLPSLAITRFSYELPTILGGLVSLIVTAVMVKFKFGLTAPELEVADHELGLHPVPVMEVVGEIVPLPTEDEDEGADGWNKKTEGTMTDDMPVSVTDMTLSDRRKFNTSEEQNPSLHELSRNIEHGSHNNKEAWTSTEPFDITPADTTPSPKSSTSMLKPLVSNTFPLLGIILLLILTRIPALGIRRLLTLRDPALVAPLGTLGTLRISASLTIQLASILQTPHVTWTYETLFTPAWLPFTLMSILTFIVHRRRLKKGVMVEIWAAVKGTAGRMRRPAVALAGATTLVALFTTRDASPEASAPPAHLLGTHISSALRFFYIPFAIPLGSLGSFFSGSTTVSNLTFGEVQYSVAENLGLDTTGMVALQVVGAALGNMICIHNILSAKVVVGLDDVGEGRFIRRCLVPFWVMWGLGTVVGVGFLFGR